MPCIVFAVIILAFLMTLNEGHKAFKKLSVFILKMITGLPFKSQQCELFKANTKAVNKTIHRVIQGGGSHVLSGLSVVKSTSHNRSNRPQPSLTTQTTSLYTFGLHKTWLVPPFWLTHATQYNRLSQISPSITHPATYIPRAPGFSYILHQSLLRRRRLLRHCILEQSYITSILVTLCTH